MPAACFALSQHSLLADGSQHVVCALVEQQGPGASAAGLTVIVGSPDPGVPQGLVARTIAEAAAAWTRWVSVIVMSVRPAAVSASVNSSRVSAPAMQPV